MSKPYDKGEDNNAKRAEKIVEHFFRESGFHVVDHPDGPTAHDLFVSRDGDEFVVEVEQQGEGRRAAMDLHGTVSIFTRRKVHKTTYTLFAQVEWNEHPKLIHFIFQNDYLNDEDFPKTRASSGNYQFAEGKKYIPVERVLSLDAWGSIDDQIRELNFQRVRQAIESVEGLKNWRKYLLPKSPYGFSDFECEMAVRECLERERDCISSQTTKE